MVIGRAVFAGMVIVLLGTIPRNIAYALNLRYLTSVPWAVPVMAVFLWYFWRYLRDDRPWFAPDGGRAMLRANPLPAPLWFWSLLAGGLGIVALVIGLRLINRMVALPPQELPDLPAIPAFTMVPLLLMSAPIAGVVEEAAFRGYMQGPLERAHGVIIAILITGTMFAVAHLDFTLVLWPYYVAVAAIYGMVTHLTDSILPSIVLHTSGNLFSNFDLWLHGQAEWQAGAGEAVLIWDAGIDRSFWLTAAVLLVVSVFTLAAYVRLAQAARAAAARRPRLV